MASKKTLKIAFPNGGIIPAGQSSNKDEKTVGPHESVAVAEPYGLQMVRDKFAYEVHAKKRAPKKQTPQQSDKPVGDDTSVEDKLNTARERLVVAEGQLADAENDDATTKAEAVIAAIKGEIDALKGSSD